MLDLVDVIDPCARRIGAINTLIIHKDGVREGRNTDAYGFIANLRHAYPWFFDQDQVKNRQIALLGAGGAARAALDGLLAEGFENIVISNRTTARAEQLAEHFQQFYPQVSFRVVTWDQAPAAMANADLLVNTTSLGMVGQDPLDFSLDGASPRMIVSDIVYTPLMTPLLQQAADRGMRVLDGLGMLLHQAVPGFAAWFGQTPVVDEVLRQIVLGDG